MVEKIFPLLAGDDYMEVVGKAMPDALAEDQGEGYKWLVLQLETRKYERQ